MASQRNRHDRWTAGYLLIVLTAGAYLPTPLYPGYRHEFAFGDLTMTLIYATFALVAAPTLLVSGKFMDTIGPRLMLRLGVVLAGLGSVGFALAAQPAWLFAARAAHGLALGVSTGAAAAILADRAAQRSTRLPGPLLAGITFVSGTAVGPLISGALSHYGSDTQGPYLLHLGLLTFGWYRLSGLPRHCGVNPSEHSTDDERRDPRAKLRGPRRLGAAIGLACLMGFLAWTVAGLFLALMPAVLTHTFGTTNTALTGGVVGLVLVWSVLAQALLARIGLAGAGVAGTASLLAALGTLATGHTSPIVLAATTVLAGIGHGLGYGVAVLSIEARAPRRRRASLTAVGYLACYLGSALPAVVVGALSRWHTLTDAVALLAAVTVPVAVVAFVASGWARRAARQDL